MHPRPGVTGQSARRRALTWSVAKTMTAQDRIDRHSAEPQSDPTDERSRESIPTRVLSKQHIVAKMQRLFLPGQALRELR
jgi:hypothetical protein